MTSSPFILYVITDLEIGGVPLHLQRLAVAIRQRGFRAAVVSLAPVGPVGRLLSEAGFAVYSCNGCCGLDFRVLARLGELIDEIRPELIHSFLFHANQATRIVAALDGFPAGRIICEIQTVEVERSWHLKVDRVTHRLCRLTVGNSASVIAHLHQNARIPMNRLQVVPGGIDIDRIDAAKPASREVIMSRKASRGVGEHGSSAAGFVVPGSEDRLVLWVGRLDPVKGLDGLLHAMKGVVQQVPNVRLLLVGDGPERDPLMSLTSDLHLDSLVQFLGPRDDVPLLLKIADLFVFPSRTEGLPNALLEAMAAGRPIVATDVPGCRDLITNERNGLVVPYGDTIALRSAIVRLLEDRVTARRFGDEARRNAISRWSIQQTWEGYEQLYRDALTDS